MRTLALTMLLCVCLQAKDGASARYIGGTVSTLKADSDGRIHTTDDLFLGYSCKDREIHVEYSKINLIEYGLNVDRRYLVAALVSPLLILSKRRQHFLSVGFTDAEGRQQAMVFRVEKGKIRALLVALEARTGLKVQYQDEQARKAGKG